MATGNWRGKGGEEGRVEGVVSDLLHPWSLIIIIIIVQSLRLVRLILLLLLNLVLRLLDLVVIFMPSF